MGKGKYRSNFPISASFQKKRNPKQCHLPNFIPEGEKHNSKMQCFSKTCISQMQCFYCRIKQIKWSKKKSPRNVAFPKCCFWKVCISQMQLFEKFFILWKNKKNKLKQEKQEGKKAKNTLLEFGFEQIARNVTKLLQSIDSDH